MKSIRKFLHRMQLQRNLIDIIDEKRQISTDSTNFLFIFYIHYVIKKSYFFKIHFLYIYLVIVLYAIFKKLHLYF